MIWNGSGVLKIGETFFKQGEEFDEELVDQKVLDQLIADEKVLQKTKTKPVEKKKDKK